VGWEQGDAGADAAFPVRPGLIARPEVDVDASIRDRSAAATLAADRRPASLTLVTLDERLEAAALKEGFMVLVPGRDQTAGGSEATDR
jgi:hypothetical protein